MNEADPSPINLDELRMVPDWLREDAPPPSKQYASHDYPTGDERGERRGGRPGGFGARGGDRRDARGGSGGGPDRRREGGRSGTPPRGGASRDRGPRGDRPPMAPAPSVPTGPAPVRTEFLPDERCLASINKQIRATHLAYPLFGLARMFLQEPERHFVQFTVAPDAPGGTTLYQLGEDGPVALDRTVLEKIAFDASKDQFYKEESVQKEPLKGNFTNVARERLSGTLLGPTNYHAYQPALRSLYESRYSRRMSFEDFRRNIEVSTDPALIERWKEEARTSTTISTVVGEGETPVVLNTSADAKNHFRQHHLDKLVRSGTTLKVHGSVARKLPEATLMGAIRESHDREMRYPAEFVQLLRQGLQNCGLHIFKHRKRVVYVSLAKPTPFVAQGAVSPNVSAILETITASPLCNRKILAERVLAKSGASTEHAPEPTPAAPSPEAVTPPVPVNNLEDGASGATEEETAPEPVLTPATLTAAITVAEDPAAKAKVTLAADLRFLVQSGHIIEFHNGTFDLPLPPKPKEPVSSPAKKVVTTRPTEPNPKSGAVATNPPPVVEAATVNTDETEFEDDDEANATVAEEVPSLLEVKEPAPTPSVIVESPDVVGSDEITVNDVVILPGSSNPAGAEGDVHDKTDDNGRISGADAAPLDPPVPGDTDDRPVTQP